MSTKKPFIDPAHVSVLIGIIAAVVVIILANTIAARKYTRWDWTKNKRYTLSPATVETLHTLPEGVQIWVLMGGSDPMEQSVKQLLVAYRAETEKLEVHYIDPDRDTIGLEDVKKRFKIETGRTEQGHVIADALAVVARGDKHWFLTTADLVEVSNADDTRVKPREEQALTGAIRNVIGGDKTRLCFTTGHGEMSSIDPGDQGAGHLKDVLEKDNFEVKEVDTASPNAIEPYKECNLVVIAGLRGAFGKDEAERLKTWMLGGGNLLLAISPIAGDTPTGLASSGLEHVVEPFGIELQETLVVETEPELVFPNTGGTRFVGIPKQHPVTAGLVKQEARQELPRIVVQFSRSMKASGTAQEILGTSPNAFGLTNVVGAADWKDGPTKRTTDLNGPLVVAAAGERPKLAPSAPHGPRIVVLGSASMLTSPTFREALPVRGSAILVESAISWLSSKPQVLDVPTKSAVAAGIKMSDDDRSELRRYVLIFMPAAFAIAGVLVAVVRRAGEGKKKKKKK